MSGELRVWRPGRPVDLAATLRPLQRGRRDPTTRCDPAGRWWRTALTPDGPGTLRLAGSPPTGEVTATAWGPGAGWLLDTVPPLLGSDDDPAGFVPRHPLLTRVAAAHPGWRVPRTGLVLEAMVPAVLEQQVLTAEARRAWRWLLARYGGPAPGPAPEGMRVVPAPAEWAAIPSWDWRRAGVAEVRARTVTDAARRAGRLEATLALPHAEADTRLQALPGVGPWTAAEVRQRAHGDPDAVSVGDAHIPSLVAWALAGRPRADDATLLELLEPWRGHRYRVVRLVELSGLRPPAYGPGRPRRRHLPR